MSIRDTLSMCFGNLMRRKGRTFLSVLGVVIGCASIVCMMSIGVGINNSQQAWLDEMGDLTSIDVLENYNTGQKLDDDLIDSIKSIPHVKFIAAKQTLGDQLSPTVSAGSGGRYISEYASVAAYDSETLQNLGLQLKDGSLPETKGSVAIGEMFEYSLKDSRRPEGKNMISYYDESTYEPYPEEERPDPYVKLTGDKIEIGVLDEYGKTAYSEEFRVTGRVKQDYNICYESDSGVIMQSSDLAAFRTAAEKALNLKRSKPSYSELKVFCDGLDNVSGVEEEIKTLGYETNSMNSMRESTQEEMNTIQLALGGIGAVSLIVAAIGIMNTMIMSVSERTKEIGIMKALGCYVADIRKLFLLEAASIGMIGGILGSVFSLAVSVLINIIYMFSQNGGGETEPLLQYITSSPERISVIPVWLFLLGMIFSMLIGLVSGAYPAMKAVKISPLEAMKNE